MVDKIADYPAENQYHLRRLLRSIEASYGGLNLLISICDNPNYRDEIVQAYEQELKTKGVICHRVQIDRQQPSLKQSLFNLNLDSNLQQPEIVTVFGIDGLMSIRLESERLSSETTNRSEQEKFFFSVQWTREALREFRFPIVLWMTESIAGELSQQAPDFWSWRGGVFEFVSPVAIQGDFVSGEQINISDFNQSNSSANPEIIQAQIEKISTINPNSPLLRNLYLSLGIAYSSRAAQGITPNRQADLEKALSIYQRVLGLSPRETFPEDWAMTQYNLANVYGDRFRGDRADNLELAIGCYKLALEVYTREDFPEDWAMTQYNLAIAYRNRLGGRANADSDRIGGDRAENLELAIKGYKSALEVYTRADFPKDWAMTQNNLATAYKHRCRGDRAENIELAIKCYESALEVYTCADFPKNWAMTQNNLANAYSDRLRGDRADNLELAIKGYNLALEVYTREDFSENWAMTQNNLANAYRNRLRGDRADNLELAIKCYNLALEVYTREAFSTKWAMTQNSLQLAIEQKNQLTIDRSSID